MNSSARWGCCPGKQGGTSICHWRSVGSVGNVHTVTNYHSPGACQEPVHKGTPARRVMHPAAISVGYPCALHNNNNPCPETCSSISNCLPHKSPTRTQEAKLQEMSDSAPTTPAAPAEGDANDAMDGVESGDTGDLAGDLFGETPQEAEETEKEKEQKREEEDADGEFLHEEPGSNTALTVIDVDSIVPVKEMTFVE